MIRQPISRHWWIGLGVASVLLLVLLYTVFAGSRQATRRREQQRIAIESLQQLSQRAQELEQRRAEARRADNTQVLTQIARDAERLQIEKENALRDRDEPDAVDRTIPTWSMLYREGLLRTCIPQKKFARTELWILDDFKPTLIRLLTALVVGVLISVVIGLLMGCYDPVEAWFLPPFAFFSKVPATAVMPIFFAVVHINFKMFVAIIAFGMLPTLAQSISQCVRKDVPEELVFKAYTLGASQLELIWNVTFRQVLPRILDAARLQIGPALVLLVAAEWLVAGEGLGHRFRLSYQKTDMSVVYFYVFLLGVFGLAADYALIWIRRRICPWFGD